MTAFKSGPYMFACGGVKDQKAPMDKVERYDAYKD